MSGDASKEDTSGILSRNSGLAGWRKAIRRVASLEDTALNDIDETYDGLVPKAEQEEWLHEKLRQLKEEAQSIATSQHSVPQTLLTVLVPQPQCRSRWGIASCRDSNHGGKCWTASRPRRSPRRSGKRTDRSRA